MAGFLQFLNIVHLDNKQTISESENSETVCQDSNLVVDTSLTVFILEDALSVWTNLGKHSLFVWLFVFSVKTSTRRIIRVEEPSYVVRLERRTTEDCSSRRIMRLVPVFTLETNN